ncbi:MAG: hypothetical protein O7G87_01845, partial [bacterium]|nr:hypothetical protein [bacterium]
LLIAEDVLGDPPPRMLPRSSLADALILFTGSDADTLPIFRSVSEDRLAGVITRADLMRSYERELFLHEHDIIRK